MGVEEWEAGWPKGASETEAEADEEAYSGRDDEEDEEEAEEDVEEEVIELEEGVTSVELATTELVVELIELLITNDDDEETGTTTPAELELPAQLPCGSPGMPAAPATAIGTSNGKPPPPGGIVPCPVPSPAERQGTVFTVSAGAVSIQFQKAPCPPLVA